MTSNVKTVGILTAHPGKEAQLRSLVEGLIGPSRSEPGNLRYDLWTDPSQPGLFVIDELYVDAAHQASPHFQHYRANVSALADRRALSLQAVAVV
ncbi:MAG: antibiotic biosynthesis monooxygenase [Sphingomonas sp. 66-10]|uniref:putative quinol monooxygenase n=1 Tax=Sphingomonas sp. 66-10 TaxID=1895848 RepID=UPI000928E140|nr:putative quinol monooxygenase [Sphingomonas sp. 66-10]OJU14578.1 MAG: antibiotic biosynthesis monooxygenase [Sphingomonas sp. 66-10]